MIRPVQPPYCMALVLCDRAERNTTTGKYDLSGTFSRLRAEKLPAQAAFDVYFALTDGFGKLPFSVRFVDSSALIDHRKPLALIDTEIDFTEPMAVIEGIVHLTMEFTSAGVYYCELMSEGNLLMSRRLLVEGPPPAGGTH